MCDYPFLSAKKITTKYKFSLLQTGVKTAYTGIYAEFLRSEGYVLLDMRFDVYLRKVRSLF